jgi:predicted nucleic acid-binding protein
MKNIKIYLDTSVVLMLDESERGNITKEFFEFTILNESDFFISEIVENEIKHTTEKLKRDVILRFINNLNYTLLPYSEESHYLAWKYVQDGVLNDNHIDDLLHVAYATVYQCDVIVSWNRKHIAKLSKIQKLNSCNIKNNYPLIAIYTPEEFLIMFK